MNKVAVGSNMSVGIQHPQRTNMLLLYVFCIQVAMTYSFSQTAKSFLIGRNVFSSTTTPPPSLIGSTTAPAKVSFGQRRRSSSCWMTGGNYFSEKDNFEMPMESDAEDDDEAFATMSQFEDHIPRVNSVTLVGRAGQDPEPKYFDDGKVVLNLSLACKRKYHPLERKVRNIKSGEEETDWFPLEIWGRDAEYASKYVEKGTRLMVTGSLQIDTWNDRNTGEPRKKAKIIVRHLDILETRAEAELRRENRGSSYQSGGNYAQKGGGGFYNSNNSNYNDNDDDGGPSPAGTGNFFD